MNQVNALPSVRWPMDDALRQFRPGQPGKIFLVKVLQKVFVNYYATNVARNMCVGCLQAWQGPRRIEGSHG